ncbi:cyclopropane fatty acyl phospholipid synthase [Chiayiivirga flava]|uniref:Cyclopropane-fatty-acyl-phospholipid synthase n=1 Tax=Chiayiivirga flava TaxID=659595 RepID=A0A7W8D4S1_9GAMM|nr:cyclopropane fatty acyl phospholipid synthase [Chiayiivirga flava]MBB5207926.1 cyclopropane-fatty-acyl-phospholipid synthase [Chiayiivirga flava]
MRSTLSRRVVTDLLAHADVRTDGARPFDLRVHDEGFYARVLAQGSLGFGESYMDGAWDSADLDELLFRLVAARLDERVHGRAELWAALRARLLNLQAGRRAWDVGLRHYDLGNDLYAAMLDPHMQYSCGYWREADTLDAAQVAKLRLVCEKLGFAPGMHVLDIGCGWGTALAFAAREYGVSGVGVTISREQAAYARERCAGLPIEIRTQDYRELDGRFDRIVSIGMFEHVGVRNYRTYFETARRLLHDDGLFLLHSIGGEASVDHTDAWIEKYIFPNSMLPSAAQIARAVEGVFVLEDWHNFGADYVRTLRAWRANIEARWQALPARYDERFRRMWRYYLAAAAAGFRARRTQLWQLVLSPRGVPGGYRSLR